jgi:4-amino-4-deoxy-L-arabinose transferase-like glycosyltransferase
VEVSTAGEGGHLSRHASSLARYAARHRARVVILVILSLAFALRTAAYLNDPRPLAGAGLAAEQAEMARNVVDHGKWFVLNPQAYKLLKKRQAERGGLVNVSEVDFSGVDRQAHPEPVVDQMPGVSAILVALWWPTGSKTYSSIQWLQIMLDTAMVLLLYWIALRLSRRTPVALLAAFIYAVWPKAILFSRLPLLDTWAPFFTIACVAAFVWARERPTSWPRLALLGFATGLGVYFRPFVILLPLALALVATPGGGWRRRLTWMLAPTAVALLLLAPWTIRNYYDFHRFIPTRTGLGQAVFEGNGQASTDAVAKSYVQRKHKDAAYGSPSYDDVLLSGAAREIADHPALYFRRVGRRAVRFLFPCILVLIVWRRWRSAALIPVAAAAATIVPYLFIGEDRRFYLPAFFAYFILLAMAADVILSLARRSRFLSRLPLAGSLVSAEARRRHWPESS